MRFTQQNVSDAIAYLKGNGAKPVWLPKSATYKTNTLFIGGMPVVIWSERGDVIKSLYEDAKTTGGRDKLFERIQNMYIGISRRDIAAKLANSETNQLHQHFQNVSQLVALL